ncbi:MAG: hypothetical protein ABI140_21625 [Jatrophihabitantaceae bacterium]
MIWLWMVLVVGLVCGGLAWCAAIADRVEDDSAGMGDLDRAPYGRTWLSILAGGRDSEH